MSTISRRSFLYAGALVSALAGTGAVLPAFAARKDLGKPTPFSFEKLIEAAQRRASESFQPWIEPSPSVLNRIGYDEHWKLRYRDEAALDLNGGNTPLKFFHLGRYARLPVKVYLVDDGKAREVLYSADLFDMPENSPARELNGELGFAGFRVMRPGLEPDWISFLGASYFRCDGPDRQYGLSARGLAIDTGLEKPEEFPRFTAFWIAEGAPDDADLTVYASLDSPSVAGAYRFDLSNDHEFGQRCTVTSRLFFRNSVARLGVAPLTSMFWYSETNRTKGADWRPEVHDSDGLAIETGSGQRIWRPIRNPDSLTTVSFLDNNPRGFGLVQRDRAFSHYQDDGAHYHQRPSTWVTPLNRWDEGAVMLVEIPTRDETFDNVVAFWSPRQQPSSGDALSYDYTLDWRRRDPEAPQYARVTATYVGRGGTPGQEHQPGTYKYVVDFEGGPIAALEKGVTVEIVGNRGEFINPGVYRVEGTKTWRLMFDVKGADEAPVDMKAYLKHGNDRVSETWVMLADHRADGKS